MTLNLQKMVQTKKPKLQSVIKDYSIMLVGLILYVLSWNLFLIPSQITGGGISGLAAGYFLQYKNPYGDNVLCD